MKCARAICFPLIVTAVISLSSGSVLADGNSVDVMLKSLHKSGVSAHASFIGHSGSTIVSIAVTGGKGKQFLPDIRSGTCAHAAATPEIPLAMASSKSRSATTIDVPLADLSDGSYVVMLHSIDGDLASLAPKSALACGAIGAGQATAPIANSAPAVGVGPVHSGSSVHGLAIALAGIAAGVATIAWLIQARGEAQ